MACFVFETVPLVWQRDKSFAKTTHDPPSLPPPLPSPTKPLPCEASLPVLLLTLIMMLLLMMMLIR